MNTKTLRLTDSAEPQEVFTNALSTKENKKGKEKKRNMTWDIFNLLSQKRAKIESDSNLDRASADIYTGDVWTRARCSEASLHHTDGTIHTADSWLLIKGRPSTAKSRSETSGRVIDHHEITSVLQSLGTSRSRLAFLYSPFLVC